MGAAGGHGEVKMETTVLEQQFKKTNACNVCIYIYMITDFYQLVFNQITLMTKEM